MNVMLLMFLLLLLLVFPLCIRSNPLFAYVQNHIFNKINRRSWGFKKTKGKENRCAISCLKAVVAADPKGQQNMPTIVLFFCHRANVLGHKVMHIFFQGGHFTDSTLPDGSNILCHSDVPCHLIASTKKTTQGDWLACPLLLSLTSERTELLS